MDKLLRITGFIPFILIVFINAYVDLGHKILIQNTIFRVYDGQLQILLTAVVNALILLPFIFLFSPAGFLSDRYSKPGVIRASALAAVVLTLLITGCYYQGWFSIAFAMTFMLAVQSAFYSPAKFGFIRELVGNERLAGANAAVQAVTIVAILLGVFLFSLLFEQLLSGTVVTSEQQLLQEIAPLGWLLTGLSLLELLLAHRLCKTTDSQAGTAPEPVTTGHSEGLKTGFNWSDYLRGATLRSNLATLGQNRAIWLSIVGLSIFWGIAQVVLAAFPSWAEQALGIRSAVTVQGLLACSGIGVVAGSVLAGKASRRHIETGLIPLGAIGVVLALALIPQLQATTAIAAAFIGLGLCGGLFIVPLNALIQFHAPGGQLGTVLAGNNWVQNLVMFGFLSLTLFFAWSGLDSLGLFHLLTLTALGGAAYTIWRLPQSLVRLLVSYLFAGRYRIQVLGFNNLPAQGAVLMLGNHISWLDWAMIQIASPRPVRFVMQREIYQRWYLKWLMDLFGVVPIAGGNSKASLEQINQLLKAGEVVCLFPEGAISRNGQLGEFKRGYERCIEEVNGVILPFYLRGLWGSRFSRSGERLQQLRNSGLRRDIIVAFGEPLNLNTPAPELKQRVFELSINAWQAHSESLDNLPRAWMETVSDCGKRLCVADANGAMSLNGYRALTGAITFSRLIRRHSQQPCVGLLLPTSSAGLIATMATLIAGRTLVNLNYTASLSALQSAVQKAEVRTVFTSKRFLKRLQQRGVDLTPLLDNLQVHYLEDMAEQISPLRKVLTLAAVRLLPPALLYRIFATAPKPKQPAAILFSSGSEGTPKGVMLSHQNIMANIRQVSDVLDTRDEDRIMATLPLFHAFGLTVTGLMPLLEGIPAICHPDPTDVLNIARGIARHRATVFCGTSTFLRLFNRNPKVHPLMLESLRVVVAGAERLSPEVREAFQLKFHKPIYEGYGTTETTPVASVNIPDRIDERDWRVQQGNRVGTVGLPLPGSSFRIVDPDTLETLPCGEDGLILIGGTQVMMGYLDDPQKTAGVIVELDGQRWYSSGDKGHLDRDGFLTIVDRYSRFAKIGGEMISLGAVEAGIAPLLKESVEILATALPDGKKGERIALLYSGDCSEPELSELLKAAPLHPLMRPSLLIAVEAIPRLGSGKSDFRAARELALRYLDEQLKSPVIGGGKQTA